MQGTIVLALAFVAAGYLLWHVLGPFVRPADRAAGCHGCAAACDEIKRASPLVDDRKSVIWMRTSDGHAARGREMPRSGGR